MKFALVLAMDLNRGIGLKGGLPWRLPGELKYFSDITTLAPSGKINAVIMGRKTWEPLPPSARPLKGRVNVILSHSGFEIPASEQDGGNVFVAKSLDEALAALENRGHGGKSGELPIHQAFVIGGANVVASALLHPDCEKMYLTEVLAKFDCDTFFPPLPEGVFEQVSVSDEHEENGVKYRFTLWERKK